MPGLHCFTFAMGGVGFKILGKCPFEVTRNATPHETDAVHGIDEGFGILGEDVADFVFNHGRLSSFNNTTRG